MPRRLTPPATAFLRRCLLLFVLALATAPVAMAESTPAAQPWLEKMIATFERPFTGDYSAALDLSGIGQPMRGTLGGRITYGDRQHMRTTMAVRLTSGEAGAEAAAAVETNILMVNDGEVTWTEIHMPAMGSRQVMKITPEDASRLAESQAGAGGNPTSMDPVTQLEAMTRVMDFELVEVAAGRVSLRGKLSEENRSQLGQLGALGTDSFLLVLDAETGFPVEIRVGEPPAVEMSFDNLSQVDRDDLPPGVFEYEPPEGVAVTDLGAMLGSQ